MLSVGAVLASVCAVVFGLPAAWYVVHERRTRRAWPREGVGTATGAEVSYRGSYWRAEPLAARAPSPVRRAALASSVLGGLLVPWGLGAVWFPVLLKFKGDAPGNDVAAFLALACVSWAGLLLAVRRATLAYALLRRDSAAPARALSVARQGLWSSAVAAVVSWSAAAWIDAHPRHDWSGLGDAAVVNVLASLPVATTAVALAHWWLLVRAARASA